LKLLPEVKRKEIIGLWKSLVLIIKKNGGIIRKMILSSLYIGRACPV